jgi:hypothetical protein
MVQRYRKYHNGMLLATLRPLSTEVETNKQPGTTSCTTNEIEDSGRCHVGRDSALYPFRH